MQKIICKKVYDTETARLVFKKTEGFYGDPAGYEETLFITPEGNYFLYAHGGTLSPCPEEKITRLSEKKAEEWLAAAR